jgi:hypothetical protein
MRVLFKFFNVRHNGKLYEKGTEHELDRADAESLIKQGFAVAMREETAAEKPAAKKATTKKKVK